MKKIAVILSGCGVSDGAEISESVLTLLAIEKKGASYQCFAPNVPQYHVVNHLTGEQVDGQIRNVLEESARIARGDIKDVAEAKPEDFDALIIPGGYGAAKNLCDFALKGTDCEVQKDVLAFTKAMATANKPVGFICISPAMIPKIYPKGTKATIGTDAETAAAINEMGAEHINCAVRDVVVDSKHKVVSTPAYMLAKSISEAAEGIEQLVQNVLAMI